MNGLGFTNAMFNTMYGDTLGTDDGYGRLYKSSGGSNINKAIPKNSGWGFNADTLGAIAGGLQALTGIGNFFTGLQGLNLAKKQFNFQKGLANRNLANQAKIVNNSYDNAAQVAAGMIGSRDANGNYGFTRQDIVNDYARRAREQHVDGSPI